MNAYARTPYFILPAFLLSLGCEEETIIRVPPPVVQTDELKQQPAALVDILWVIDNSESMAEEQEALAQNFNSFITGLTVCQGGMGIQDVCDFTNKTCTISGAPCNPPDYHIGVVSTDTAPSAPTDQGRLRQVGTCVPAAGQPAAGGKLRYCRSNNAQCAHNPNDPNSDPANAVCDMSASLSFITASTPNAIDAFSRAVTVGIDGSAREEGIRAAAQALGRDTDRATGMFTPALTENMDFLRPEASLFVIFVSDEDDKSFGEVPYFYRIFESLKRAGNEGLVSFSAIVGDVDVDGPDGPTPGGCASMSGAQQANFAGTRYVGLAMYSRGLTAEFRVCDGKRLTCGAGSECRFPVPDLPGLCVPTTPCQIDGDCGNFKCGDKGCISCESTMCQTDAPRFVQLLERNGIFGSICADDYGQVLDALGFEAAGLKRKFELTKFPDCAEANKSGQGIECFNGTEAPATDVPTALVCVKVNGEVVPNSRDEGWIYEPGSNSVFFDGNFIPPTDADVQISYRVSSADSQLSCTELLE